MLCSNAGQHLLQKNIKILKWQVSQIYFATWIAYFHSDYYRHTTYRQMLASCRKMHQDCSWRSSNQDCTHTVQIPNFQVPALTDALQVASQRCLSKLPLLLANSSRAKIRQLQLCISAGFEDVTDFAAIKAFDADLAYSFATLLASCIKMHQDCTHAVQITFKCRHSLTHCIFPFNTQEQLPLKYVKSSYVFQLDLKMSQICSD